MMTKMPDDDSSALNTPTNPPLRPIGQKFLYIYLDTKPPTAFIYEVISHQSYDGGLTEEIFPVTSLPMTAKNGIITIEIDQMLNVKC